MKTTAGRATRTARNASERPADPKLKRQAYITGCYGSLASFNVLFADEDERFVGASQD